MPARLDVEQLDLCQALTDLSAALCGTTAPAPTPPDPIPTLNSPLTPDHGTRDNRPRQTPNFQLPTSPLHRPPHPRRQSPLLPKRPQTRPHRANLRPHAHRRPRRIRPVLRRHPPRPPPPPRPRIRPRRTHHPTLLASPPRPRRRSRPLRRSPRPPALPLQQLNARRRREAPDAPPIPTPPESPAGALATNYGYYDDKTNPHAKLARYEAHLDRALARCLKQLQDLQRRPAEEPLQNEVPHPTAPDEGQMTSDQGPTPNDPPRTTDNEPPTPAHCPPPTEVQNEPLPATPTANNNGPMTSAPPLTRGSSDAS